MSASDESFEYHLTPRGWVEGSEKLDFAARIERPIPKDRVATFVENQHMGSVFSRRVSVTWYQIWPDAKVDLTALYEQFGEHPADVARHLERGG